MNPNSRTSQTPAASTVDPAPINHAVRISAGLRKFLYLTACITGAAILIVEILGAKMLSPFVGTSHFVWTAQITITLLSLATGYWFGGWLVDRSTKLSRLYMCLLSAAVYLALTILVVDRVAYVFLEMNLAMGALFASATLFFIPLTLLAATGPFLIKVLASSMNVIGQQVGRLSAISTLGSVAGTLLIGYVLIPFLPNSVTMYVTAGVLAALCLAYMLLWGRAEKLNSAFILILTMLIVGGLGVKRDLSRKPSTVRELFRGNSNFGLLQVLQTADGRRFYLNDYLFQNTYSPAQKESLSLFTYMLHRLAHGYNPAIKKVLSIGMGIGIVPMKFQAEGAEVTTVEINPDIVPVAEKFFDFDPSKVKVVIQDGRYYLNSRPEKYDAIALDAFLGDASPSHLMTKEAFTSMKQRLNENGVLVINSFCEFQPGRNFMANSLHKTLQSVFSTVKIHATGNGNVFFVASDSPLATFTPPPINNIPDPDMQRQVLSGYNSLISVNSSEGMVLTDDFNPAEFFDAPNRENHRRNLAQHIGKL